MSSTEPGEPWASAMRAAEIGDPRNGRPSWNQLAARAGVSVSAITNAVKGKTRLSPPNVQRVAEALRVKPEVVSGWLRSTPVYGPYLPPPEAALLSDRERQGIDALIRALAQGRQERDGHEQQPAPMTGDPEVVSDVDRARAARALRAQLPDDIAARRGRIEGEAAPGTQDEPQDPGSDEPL